MQAVRTTTEPDSRTRGCENHEKTSRISSRKIVYEPATEPGGAHRRWLPYEKRLFTGAVCVDVSAAYNTVKHLLGKVLEMTDTHHAGKQTLLRGAEREEEPLATTTKGTTTGKCTFTDAVQHLHQRPVRRYTPTLAASSTQTTCASRCKETT